MRGASHLRTEPLLAVAGAELPEGGEPWRAVAIADAGAGGDHPALHDLLKEAVPDQALAVGSPELLGLEHVASACLKSLQGIERVCEFLMRFSQRDLQVCAVTSFSCCSITSQ